MWKNQNMKGKNKHFKVYKSVGICLTFFISKYYDFFTIIVVVFL